MDAQAQFAITLDGRTLVAEPRPEDQTALDELLRRGTDITIAQSDSDTEGHVLAADEISVDVEGHAMTLRLPNATDAAALRRALAVGALTATVAIGGFVAGHAGLAIGDSWTLPPPPRSAPDRRRCQRRVGLADGAQPARTKISMNKSDTGAAPSSRHPRSRSRRRASIGRARARSSQRRANTRS